MSEQRERELPPGGADARVVVPEDGEEFHEMLARLVALLTRRPPHDVEQQVEGFLHVAGAQQEICRPGLGRHVLRRGLGGGEGVGPGLFGPAEQLHLA